MLVDKIDYVTFTVNHIKDIPNVLFNAWIDELMVRCEDYIDDGLSDNVAEFWTQSTDICYDTYIMLSTEDMDGYEINLHSGDKAKLQLILDVKDDNIEVTVSMLEFYVYIDADELTSQYFLNLLYLHLTHKDFRGITWDTK